jgi:hypothetical protein
MPPPALPPGLPEPREALPVELADECSDYDDYDDFTALTTGTVSPGR